MNDISDSQHFLYLCRRDVEIACQQIDTVQVMRDVFTLHATGKTILPEEAYLSWTNTLDEEARSLNMPGYIGEPFQAVGTKIINANPSNPHRNIVRADGLTMLFDPTTAHILCVMEGAYVSALRTASVTALAVDLLKPARVECLAVIGSGVLADFHINILAKRLPDLRQIWLFDLVSERAFRLQVKYASALRDRNIVIRVAETAEEAIRAAQIVVPATTTSTSYIPFTWVQAGTVLIDISLDDVYPDVVLKANKVIIDDWTLVKADKKRLLGRMFREGLIDFNDNGEKQAGVCRRIDAELGEIVVGKKPGRSHNHETILVNPFGLSIEDIALAKEVYKQAQKRHMGTYLAR